MGKKSKFKTQLLKVSTLSQGQSLCRPIKYPFTPANKETQAWLEHSPSCNKIVDLDFNLRYMNGVGMKYVGIKDITPYYGKPYPLDFYSEDYKVSMLAQMKQAISLGQITTQEAALVNLKGKELWFHSTIIPVFDDGGQLDSLMIVSIDVTDRRRAEETALNNANLIQNIIDTSPDLILVKDTQYRFILCNQRCAQVVGKTHPEELYGLTLEDMGQPKELVFGNPEKGIRGWNLDDRKVLSGKTLHIDSERIYINGETRYFNTIKSPLLDSKGNIIGLLGISRDITEKLEEEKNRKKLEEAAIENANIIQSVLDTLPDPLFVKDKQLKTILCNKSYAHLTGYESPEELYGLNDIEIGWDRELVLGNPKKGIRGYANDDKEVLKGKLIHSESEPGNVKGISIR